ncbi:MAG: LuxR C-terminal-related transcriptional regulator [Pseudomonadales bacterium]|nr:LuxR C-terminal-related transcriptional regulator [Pseudomonadales bacterium]
MCTSLIQLNVQQLSTFADAGIEALTAREKQILKLIAGGFSNREIAGTLFLASGTVKNHVSNVLAKLKTRD